MELSNRSGRLPFAPPRSAAGILLAAAAFAAAAPTAAQVDPTRRDHPPPAATYPTIDEEFDALAEIGPGGFGGWFFDRFNNLNIYLTDPGRSDEAIEVLLPIFQERFFEGTGEPSLRVLQGRYDARQLLEWRTKLRDVFSVHGVTGLGVHHDLNRLGIGVQEISLRPLVEERVRELGIPLEAVVIRESRAPPPTRSLDRGAGTP